MTLSNTLKKLYFEIKYNQNALQLSNINIFADSPDYSQICSRGCKKTLKESKKTLKRRKKNGEGK